MADPKEDRVSELASTGPDHELMIDTASPPEEIKERTIQLINYMKGKDVNA